jgi:hypothetical protein
MARTLPSYVKDFEIDRQKVANIVGDEDAKNGMMVVVDRLNRNGYLNISGGYGLPGPDGKRDLSMTIALAFGGDEEELKKKDLGEIDESS